MGGLSLLPPGCWGAVHRPWRGLCTTTGISQTGWDRWECGGCSSLCPSRIPCRRGLQEGRMTGKGSSWQGESVVSGPWISSRWIIPRRVSGWGARTELGSVTGWGTWQYHTVFFSFWLSVSSWLDFAQAKCRTVKRKRCLHQTLSNVSQTPVLLPLLKQILCWDWRTEIADLVYPQNQCSPEAVDGTSGVLRLWKSQIPLCPCKIFGSGVNYYQV